MTENLKRFIPAFSQALPSRSTVFILAALMLLCLLSPPRSTLAEEDEKGAKEATLFADQMEKSLAAALASHRAELAQLAEQLRQLESMQEPIRNEAAAYDSQNTAHGQLLLVPNPRIEDLKIALLNNMQSARRMAESFRTLQESYDSTLILSEHAADLYKLAIKQIADIRMAKLPEVRKQGLESAAGNLLQVLKEKNQSAERYLDICRDLLARMKVSLEAKKAIGEKLAARIQDLQKKSLWMRADQRHYLSAAVLREAPQAFGRRAAALFRPETLKALWDNAKMKGVSLWAVFWAALAGILLFQGRWRAFLRRIEDRCEGPAWYYRRLGIHLLRKSLPLIGMALLFGIISLVNVSLLDIGLGRFLFDLFLVLLLTRWGLDYLGYEHLGPPTKVHPYVTRHLKRFFRFLRVMLIAVLILSRAVGGVSPLTWMARDLLLAVVLAWAVVFWRRLKPIVAEGVRIGQVAPDPKRMAAVRGAVYLFAGGSLALGLAGYENLARHWASAAILTVALLFWGWVCRNVIREWQRDHLAGRASADKDTALESADEFRGSLIRLARLGWFAGLAAGIVWAWDSSGNLFSLLGFFFNLTITIGKLTLSVRGVVLAALIIFFTYLAVRLGRLLLSEKILEKKALERGLKDSILTIASYLAWGVGLTLALGVLGIDGTSLAVVFGAVSIGIGFGLQTIFNNFISGLILLFERPIQVGDMIEVNGLWAEVKKINVRATVVQTFDNAAVIIPNSEFISQRVTNWSFKDKRMRRSLDVGVAYGSDIGLVQKTLMEIVRDSSKVYKYPKPEVLFIDHADSALIFRLRVWLHVDDYWTVASEIRCEIDRRFRELSIEIAFPQRDLHIRTIPEGWSPAAPAGVSDGSPSSGKPAANESP